MHPRSLPGVDLVMPVYNEERELPAVLDSLARQVDGEGRPLPPDALRIVAVDNGSSDGSKQMLEAWAADPGTPPAVVLEEKERGVVAARVRGSELVLRPREAERFPVVVHADSDNLFPPGYVDDVRRRFAAGTRDVVSYLGFCPTRFWRRVPRLARRQIAEVGSLGFSRETLAELGLDETPALLTPQVFEDFENVPSQVGLAMTKEIFARAGGYVREFNRDGSERLGEARNLLFRLDRVGARMGHTLSPWVELNPRRLLLEAENLWAGRSYADGMTNPRGEIRDQHYTWLDAMTERLDYPTLLRNGIQRHIVDPCVAVPERLRRNRPYFGSALEAIRARIEEAYATRDVRLYVDVRAVSDEIIDTHHRTIIANLRRLRGLT